MVVRDHKNRNRNKSQDVTSMLHKSGYLFKPRESNIQCKKGYRDEARASLALWCQVIDAFKPSTFVTYSRSPS